MQWDIHRQDSGVMNGQAGKVAHKYTVSASLTRLQIAQGKSAANGPRKICAVQAPLIGGGRTAAADTCVQRHAAAISSRDIGAACNHERGQTEAPMDLGSAASTPHPVNDREID